MKSPILASLLAALTLQSQTDKVPTSTTYHDDQLHFSFSYPADLINRVTPESLAKARAAATPSADTAKVPGCTTIPVAAVRPVQGLFDMVMILRLDQSCAGTKINRGSLPSFASGMVKQMLASHGPAASRSTKSFDIAGHPAIFMTATVDETSHKPGQILQSGSVCILVDSQIVCLQAISYKPDVLKTLLLSPIAFDGEKAHPLVPNEVLSISK